ncbi:MAG: hypothetical protein JSS65_01300 [Armatimonadetes bacterium]|nr:hypothetical protein [Armatimonadota bacterium]
MSINSNYNNPLPIDGVFKSGGTGMQVDGQFRSSGKASLDALGSALQSGDLSGAQTAFANLQAAHKGHHHHGGATAAGGRGNDHDGDDKKVNSSKSAFGADFKALATALQNNDLAAAQQAWTKLQADRPQKPTDRPAVDPSTGTPATFSVTA